MKSCLEEYKECDINDIAEKYIEGQPQVSAVPRMLDVLLWECFPA